MFRANGDSRSVPVGESPMVLLLASHLTHREARVSATEKNFKQHCSKVAKSKDGGKKKRIAVCRTEGGCNLQSKGSRSFIVASNP